MSNMLGLISQTQISASDKTPTPARTSDHAKAREAAESFEAFFLAKVLGSMFEGIKADGPFGGGQGEAMFRPLLLQEYGKATASRGGIGIADAVMREILAAQEIGK